MPVELTSVRRNGPFSIPHGPKKTILLVEAEVMLLDALAYILRRAGYEILVARTATTAIDICARSPMAVDLVLSDFNLLGGNGIHFAESMMTLRPNLPIIFMSGNTAGCRELRSRGFIVLQKPFPFEE